MKGALSSEIVHLLKVKLSLLKMTPDGFFCFLGFQNCSGEDPGLPFQIRKYVIYF